MADFIVGSRSKHQRFASAASELKVASVLTCTQAREGSGPQQLAGHARVAALRVTSDHLRDQAMGLQRTRAARGIAFEHVSHRVRR